MTDIDPEMTAHLEHVVDGLVNNTGGALPRHELREVVFDCYERLAQHATVTTFLPVLTSRYAMMRVRSMGILTGDLLKSKPEVLVLDEHNAARSQAATALIRFYAPGRYRVDSAGIHPDQAVNEVVIGMLADVGVGLTDFPKQVTPEILLAADYVIAIGEVTMDPGVRLSAPVVQWGIPDPAHSDRGEARAILAQIDANVRVFLKTVDPDHRLHPALLGSAPPG